MSDAPASSNAGPDAPQWADGSVGVLQVGFLDIGTPIRVLSDHEITRGGHGQRGPGPGGDRLGSVAGQGRRWGGG